jgi:hypothetical protein
MNNKQGVNHGYNTLISDVLSKNHSTFSYRIILLIDESWKQMYYANIY